ncbi:MAG: transposase [Planctomycetia bacterium]|nr:transposase [Planctomycetia bacterium]
MILRLLVAAAALDHRQRFFRSSQSDRVRASTGATSAAMMGWVGIATSPESFSGRLRDEFLVMEIFEDVRDARPLTVGWRHEYNTERPHSALGCRTPAGFAAACAASASAKASAPAAHAGCLGQPCS